MAGVNASDFGADNNTAPSSQAQMAKIVSEVALAAAGARKSARQVFISTMAALLSVSPSRIVITGVKTLPNRQGIEISYTVSLILERTSFTDTSQLANSLTAAVVSSVNTGAFAKQLKAANSTTFSTATVTTPTVGPPVVVYLITDTPSMTPTLQPTKTPLFPTVQPQQIPSGGSSSSGTTLDSTMIAGIAAAASVAGLCGCGLLFRYLYSVNAVKHSKSSNIQVDAVTQQQAQRPEIIYA